MASDDIRVIISHPIKAVTEQLKANPILVKNTYLLKSLDSQDIPFDGLLLIKDTLHDFQDADQECSQLIKDSKASDLQLPEYHSRIYTAYYISAEYPNLMRFLKNIALQTSSVLAYYKWKDIGGHVWEEAGWIFDYGSVQDKNDFVYDATIDGGYCPNPHFLRGVNPTRKISLKGGAGIIGATLRHFGINFDVRVHWENEVFVPNYDVYRRGFDWKSHRIFIK